MKQNQKSFCLFSSFILHPSSFILHPSSFILHPSSFILHPSSFILHPSSFILHPSSFITALALFGTSEKLAKRSSPCKALVLHLVNLCFLNSVVRSILRPTRRGTLSPPIPTTRPCTPWVAGGSGKVNAG